MWNHLSNESKIKRGKFLLILPFIFFLLAWATPRLFVYFAPLHNADEKKALLDDPMNANYIDNDSFRNLVAAELIIFILLGAFGVVSLMLSVPFGIILYIEGTRGRPLTPEEGKRFSRSATFFIRFWR